MKVLVVGGGGREHAVIKSLKRSKRVSEIFCAPGNGGISDDAYCIDIKATDLKGMTEFALKENIDLVCVTPDDPLCAGMVDIMKVAGIRAFGPEKSAAVIEGSKTFSKDLMKKHGIPSGSYETFDDAGKAVAYLKGQKMPTVVKADGLALGKGVLICRDLDQAILAIEDIMIKKKFGRSGERVVIEEYLEGPEVSVLAFCDGKTLKTMPSSQDHKKAFDGDKGLNTGGMGAFTPSGEYTLEIEKYCNDKIFMPTLEALKNENIVFKGVLYFGLMLTAKGPKVLEYNARFGDPETQVILPLLNSDLLDIFDACIDGELENTDISWSDEAAVCVVMASGGYPESYQKGLEITGLDKLPEDRRSYIYHAGTKKEEGRYYTDGGRVLGVTAVAENIRSARDAAYGLTSKIDFEGMFYRKDIGIK